MQRIKDVMLAGVIVVASVAAVCLGALLGLWAWTATSNTHEVVAVRAVVVGELVDGDVDPPRRRSVADGQGHEQRHTRAPCAGLGHGR